MYLLYTFTLRLVYFIRIMVFQDFIDLQVLNGGSLAIVNAVCLGKLVDTFALRG